MDNGQYITCTAWGEDMLQAFFDLPMWRKYLLTKLMGKYMHREACGLWDAVIKSGGVIGIGYGLQDMDYHKEKTIPIWKRKPSWEK